MAEEQYPISPLVLPGSLAISKPRLASLEQKTGARRATALWVHYIQPKTELTNEHNQVLEQLLDYDEPPEQTDTLSQQLRDAIRDHRTVADDDNGGHIVTLYVTPRAGTISPWSSQATGIVHIQPLGAAVKRVERGIAYALEFDESPKDSAPQWLETLYDRMTQQISWQPPNLQDLFGERQREDCKIVPLLAENGGTAAKVLETANVDLGLALDRSEIEYLETAYGHTLRRNPADVELFMFAQVNSEHCRHKQFNAQWTIDGRARSRTLFDMIRNTHKRTPQHVISAYSDNAAVFEGEPSGHWYPDAQTGDWKRIVEPVHILGKVETHNHPTAVSPYPGAATGSGGEIRDEAAVGRGSRSKAGIAGFCVSQLDIPGARRPWEFDVGKPEHIASGLDIMLEAPIGSARYNNEFGRPCLAGFFRTLLLDTASRPSMDRKLRGYHKPMMLAGGVGNVRPMHALKDAGLVKPGAHLVVIGGPAMLIGLGGGAASSVQSGQSSVQLDYASVQRDNAEIQRRAQELINTCTSLGQENPILSIHDVGAGGLSNALPELVHDAGLGAQIELREIASADKGMSPLQIWCNEAQERYVAAIDENSLEMFLKLAARERCEVSVVGRATQRKQLVVSDRESKDVPIPVDLPMAILFGKPARLSKQADRRQLIPNPFDTTLQSYLPDLAQDNLLPEAVSRVLSLPAVASKSYLITIGDRTVGGLTARDQMAGPWQVPVSDVAVTTTALVRGCKTGEAMTIGERPALALLSPSASAKMAVAEALTNLAAADTLGGLQRVKLSANWMAATSHTGEGAALYEAVEALGMDLCPALGLGVPVGKDSLSMKMRWKDAKTSHDVEVTSPVSLVVTAFAPVRDVSRTWTPALRRFEDVGETLLMFVDLAEGRHTMGGSALAQTFGQCGKDTPTVHDDELLKDYMDAVDQLHEADIVLAYHDRSDGGLFTTLVEMAFAGRCGLEIMLDYLSPSSSVKSVVETLFNEELGAVFQIRKQDEIAFKRCFATSGPPPGLIKRLGRVPPASNMRVSFLHGTKVVYADTRANLQKKWAETSYLMQRLRDDTTCAEEEYANIDHDADPGLSYNLTFKPKDNILPFTTSLSAAFVARPRVAILREEGTNGQAEMAFAFHTAGFAAVDVHMTDIIAGRVSLAGFRGLAACGGFSYGDVLGAGQGWAKSVLLHSSVRSEFETFFARPDTFTLGVCNGCQFLAKLKGIIPGAAAWPAFERNRSEQYEARACMVRIQDDANRPSVFLHGMHGSAFPIAVAHGEGRATFRRDGTAVDDDAAARDLVANRLVPMQYTDNRLRPTARYPFNPNGSPSGVAAVRSVDGRVLALMPHPERTVLRESATWLPHAMKEDWGEYGPWIRLFMSARKWAG